MRKVTIEIEMNGSAFEPDPLDELARILLGCVGKVQQQMDRPESICTHPESADKILDYNGNTVGFIDYLQTDKYAWIMDVDRIDGPAEGLEGPYDAPRNLLERLWAKQGTPFRIFDDDDELYYEGRIIGDFNGLEPLRDYARPNAGATRIELFEYGQWVRV